MQGKGGKWQTLLPFKGKNSHQVKYLQITQY